MQRWSEIHVHVQFTLHLYTANNGKVTLGNFCKTKLLL